MNAVAHISADAWRRFQLPYTLDRGRFFVGRKPRLHDLRHTFSVATILRWHAEGEDVNAMMPYLSAYLGHRKLSDTYWYLTGVPELMAVAADSFRAMGLGGDAP